MEDNDKALLVGLTATLFGPIGLGVLGGAWAAKKAAQGTIGAAKAIGRGTASTARALKPEPREKKPKPPKPVRLPTRAEKLAHLKRELQQTIREIQRAPLTPNEQKAAIEFERQRCLREIARLQ